MRRLAEAQQAAEVQRAEEARMRAAALRAAELQRAAAEAQRAAAASPELQRAQAEAQRAAEAVQRAEQEAAAIAQQAAATNWHGGINGMAEFIIGSVTVDERGLADGGRHVFIFSATTCTAPLDSTSIVYFCTVISMVASYV